jgi:hypothetical protein
MMGIVVPETCWASKKICNKNHLLRLVGILFPHSNFPDYFSLAFSVFWTLYFVGLVYHNSLFNR